MADGRGIYVCSAFHSENFYEVILKIGFYRENLHYFHTVWLLKKYLCLSLRFKFYVHAVRFLDFDILQTRPVLIRLGLFRSSLCTSFQRLASVLKKRSTVNYRTICFWFQPTWCTCINVINVIWIYIHAKTTSGRTLLNNLWKTSVQYTWDLFNF